MRDVCPRCGEDDAIGMEYPRTYDGVLIWICAACDWARTRQFRSERLLTVSREAAEAYNTGSEPDGPPT